MGSQTFEILRQGVWASLTGGWFYDPHQTVFCNVIHLYLWLFLLCGPFLTYLYFPTTFLTWTIYCVVTTFTVTILKILNMALHILYDKAQAISDPSFKIDTKSTKTPVSDECGIEMQVIGNDLPSRISIEQPINEVSEANSMLSLDHVTSTIDLKVDVHRKNSSESSDSVPMYPANIYQNINQTNDGKKEIQQIFMKNMQSLQNQSTETTQPTVLAKERELSRRYSDNLQKNEKALEIPSQYSVPIFKDYTHNSMLVKHNPLRNRQHNRNFSQGQDFLSEVWKNTQLNNLQTPSPKAVSCSLYQIKGAPEPAFGKCLKNYNADAEGYYNPIVRSEEDGKRRKCIDSEGKTDEQLAAEAEDYRNAMNLNEKSLDLIESEDVIGCFHGVSPNDRLIKLIDKIDETENKSNGNIVKKFSRTTKLQRHRSTESHEENQRRQNRSFLMRTQSRQDESNSANPIEENNSASSSTLQLTTIKKQEMQPKLPIISSYEQHNRLNDKILRSSDMYLSNSNYTKSDLGIEQLNENLALSGNNCKDMHSMMLLKQQNNMRKDSNSTMSALQLPVAASILNLDQQQSQNKRRHSNSSCKPGNNNSEGSNVGLNSNVPQSSNVRRIKSTALDVACTQPSVSNLSPHPNSTEAIAGQQLKSLNPPLLPPPSKCLVRNQHLILCSNVEGEIDESDRDAAFKMDGRCIQFATNNNKINCDNVVFPITEYVDKVKPEKAKTSNLIQALDLSSDENNEEDKNELKFVGKNFSLDPNERRSKNVENLDEVRESNMQSIALDEERNCDKISRIDIEDKTDAENNDEDMSHNDKYNNVEGDNLQGRKLSSHTTESDSEIERPRTQSTDSETDNNGSRSPLLNKCNGRENVKPKIVEIQQPKMEQHRNDKFHKALMKNSDYEQVSSSSKDILLQNTEPSCRKMEMGDKEDNSNDKEQKSETQDECGEICRGLNIALEEADIENLRLKDAKSLGAIPKTRLRRSSEIPIGIGAPLGLTNMGAMSTKRSIPKSMSRTSSSASSRSFSAESFSNDVYKTYRDRYSYLLGQDIGQQIFVHTRRNINENLGNFRLKHRLNIIDHENATSNAPCLENGREVLSGGVMNGQKLETSFDFGSDDMQKAHEAATTLSIQGLINEQYSFENSLASAAGDQRHSRQRPPHQSSTGAILNVEINDSIYCDYWRSCRLSTEKPVQPKKLYKYKGKFLGKHEFKITMDRLQLLALFDRDLNWLHVTLAILLSSLTCFLGAYILQLEIYKDIFAFVFCIVIAGSQYSLLKSVQPDAASPIHGFNKTVAYSRPIYFCLCSSLLIFSFQLTERFTNESHQLGGGSQFGEVQRVEFFGVTFALNYIMESVTNFLSIILLLFPLFFSLGLFPQVNTFCMYLLEQIDMHIFGGNAVCSLLASVLCVLKSLIAVSILYGPAFGALSEEKGSQHFLFSFFCSLLIPISYHLSRSASDFSHIWTLIKSGLANSIPDDDDDDEVDDDDKVVSKKSVKTSSSGEVDEKSNQAQVGESSTKATTSPSSGATCEDLQSNAKNENNETAAGVDAADMAESSQQSKTGFSTESKLDISEDKTDLNNHTEQNELSTLDSNSVMNGDAEQSDPLPKKLQTTVNSRLKNDLVVSTILALLVLGLHCSTVFTVLQPDLNTVLYIMAGFLGFILHYVLPQLRKHMPWLCFAAPILRQKEYGQFEVSNAAKIMWFEAIYVCFCFLERNVLYPLIFISALTADSQHIANKFGNHAGALIISICALKCVRNAYSDPANQYLILIFSVLLFKLDFNYASETFLINFFLTAILFKKSCDFLLKLQFIVTYIAPWQITWGSAFHAFAQPFSVPHSAMLFLQAAISAILSTPLNPFLGSAIFLTSYVRPIKFWERDYNTRRIDHSNTRLSSQLERDLGADDNNLNSIFYEHLTRSLQHSLCGDLLLGRWGNVNQGDCFVLASDYLNCLVHIIELGNGLCTFQMRGLEFRGTYCQQREVEAISEGVEDNDACCCCNPGHIPKMLSANAMFSTRWLAWQVVAAQYVLEGYSISENLATATLQPFEFRKVLITYYIKSIIYYVTKNSKLEKWLAPGPIQYSLASTLSRQFVDLDPIFNYNLDEDFDFRALGITRSSFCLIYLNWIQLCYKKRKDSASSANLPAADVLPTDLPAEPKLSSDDRKTATATETTNGRVEPNAKDQQSKNESSAKMSQMNEDRDDVNNASEGKRDSSASKSKHDFKNSEYFKNITEDGKADASSEAYASVMPLARSSSHVRCRKKVYKRRLKFGVGAHSDAIKNNLQSKSKTESAEEANSFACKDSPLVSLCLALGLLARRSLATASHSSLSGVEFFLHGLHALFKGDFRITSPRDEWVFADMELLHGVVAPAVKMALKLHQDHFSSPDEYLDPSVLYDAMSSHTKELVISHEADPIWRSAVLKGAPNLLALRHVMEDGSDEYRIIRLTKRFLSFRVIKLNRECVRGLWAGQQQELIYLRNRNPERGSIQNAKQALRNIINSSCDQPIGYPIYVSPLTTSYADTNEQICRIIGGAITFESIKGLAIDSWRRVRERCREGCSSGSGGLDCDGINGVNEAPVVYFSPTVTGNTTGTLSYGSQSLSGTGTRGSLASMNKPNSSTLLTTFLKRDLDQERDMLRDGKVNNSGTRQKQGASSISSVSSKDRDRRATLPITSTRLSSSSRELIAKDQAESVSRNLGNSEYQDGMGNSSSKSNKVSNSSCNLEDFDNKTSCGASTDNFDDFDTCDSQTKFESKMLNQNNASDDTFCRLHILKERVNHPLIELNRKAIIVNGLEIYDCLDLGRRIDVVWPNEKMRSNGGRSTWQDWSPQEGMVGYVRHYWQPNHPDIRFRSNVNGTLYLIEINDHYVPIGECGVREYNQINPMEQQSMMTVNTVVPSIIAIPESSINYPNSIGTMTRSQCLLNKDGLAMASNSNDAKIPLALALKSIAHWDSQASHVASSSLDSTVPEIFSPNSDNLTNVTSSSEYCDSLDINSLNRFHFNFQFPKNNRSADDAMDAEKSPPCLDNETENRTKDSKYLRTIFKVHKSKNLECKTSADDDPDHDDDSDDSLSDVDNAVGRTELQYENEVKSKRLTKAKSLEEK